MGLHMARQTATVYAVLRSLEFRWDDIVRSRASGRGARYVTRELGVMAKG